jgi:hypothetical protein
LTGTVITGINPVGGADHVIDAIRYAATNVLSDDAPQPDDGGVMYLFGHPTDGRTTAGKSEVSSLESAKVVLDSLPRRGAPQARRRIRHLLDGRQQQIPFAAEKPRLAPVDR